MPSIASLSLLAATLLAAVSAQHEPASETRLLIPTPTATIAAGALVNMGCYTDGSNLQDHGPGQFQTDGTCQQICLGLQMPVMAIWRGSNCFCGTEMPALQYKDDNNASCTSTCNGFGELTCGGPRAWTVWDTALFSGGIDNFDPSTVTSVATSVSTPGAAMTETPPSAAPTQPAKEESSGGPSKAGIAAGVVVGVLAIAALIGGVVLFLKRRKRRAVEEEYQRNAAMKDFYGKPPGTGHSSLTDNRLDPETQMRRQSNGSIADNQDFSRRVLQIRNPDGA